MRESLISAAAQLEQAIAGLESLINELRPASLDELGTGAAVETLVERMRARSDLEIGCTVDLAYERGDEPTRHTPRLESTVYRIVQEALNNATKHSGASNVTVAISESPETVEVVVEDDGKGFDPETAGTDRFGLHIMRERIELLDGTLQLDSTPGSGTRVHARLPVERVSS
jgi:signal transduction histidine kinase